MQETTSKFIPLPAYENFEATTQIMISEILRRNLPLEIIDADNNLISTCYKGKEYLIHEGTISDANSLIAYWISNDKWMSRQILLRKGIRQAKGLLLQNEDPLTKALQIPFPSVVKPADTDHGIAVSTNITTTEDLEKSVAYARKFSHRLIVEEFFPGQEYRFLVIDGQVRAIAYREPANITGDGIHSIQQLIATKNIGRGEDYRYPLLKIKIDEEVHRHLTAQSLRETAVLPAQQKVYLRKNSNLSTGGDSIDMTDAIPDFYKKKAVEAANAAGLRLAGIDMIIQNFNQRPSADNYIIIELNAPAMLSMHDFPYIGKNRHVERYVLDCIFNGK